MSLDALGDLPAELCRVFLGWRLREDYEALLALEEGALRIDLKSGEAWCDGEPVPPLFIAGELHRALEQHCARAGMAPDALELAQLDALFSRHDARVRGEDRPALTISCRATLRAEGRELHAEAHNRNG